MITTLTADQAAKIPEFITKWVNKASAPTDRKKATKAVKNIYKNMGEEEPIVVFGQSPFSTAIMAALFFESVKTFKRDDNQLDNQLYSQLYGQLRNQLDSQLDNQLRNQLRNQLDSQLDSQLRNQLDSQLDNQLYSQLYSQLRNQLRNQLDSQLRNQLRNQLDSQLRNQLDSQLRNQLDSQLRNQLDSQLRSINGDWYMSIWWLVWSGWYDYGQYIGVQFDKKTYDLFISFVENVGFIIPYKNIVFISENPIAINWLAEKLHSDRDLSVKYADGWGIHNLYGISFENNITIWEKIRDKTLTAEDAISIKDIDQRKVAIKYLGAKDMIKSLDAKEVNRGNPRHYQWNERLIKRMKTKRSANITTQNILYKVTGFFNNRETKYFLYYTDPSTGEEYISFCTQAVKERGEDADACQAWKHHLSKEQYMNMYLEA